MRSLFTGIAVFAFSFLSLNAQQAPPMATVATLDDLLSRAPRTGEAIGVQTGYGGVEWGGLRIFVLQATNVTALPTNVAHVFAVTNLSGARGQWVSVDRTNTVQDSRWWRVNSGDSNINAAVQNIVDYGQALGGVVVTFPKGSYTLTAWPPIYVTNNTTIVGVPGQTVFNFSGATNAVQYGVAIHNATNASVSGVSYWWPTNTLAVPNPETVIAVDIRNSRTITVSEVTATNLKGINVGGTQGSYDVQVSRMVVTASPQVGGAHTYASNVKYTDCIWQGSTGDYVTYNVVGFDVEPNTGQVANDIVFTRCGFLNNMEDGLSLVSSANRTMSNIRLVDCYSSGNGTSGLSIQAGEDIVVSGWQSTNDYSGFAFTGYGSIYATLSKNISIQGCTIRGNANNSGINLAGVNGFTVTGNTIDGVTLDGIQIADATAREFTGVISLIGNRILRPARYGLYYSGVVGIQALGNTIIQAGQNGVHATFSINNIFANNLIAESGNSGNGYYGIRLAASSTNSVYGNTFLENLVSLNTTNQAGTASTAQFATNAMAFDGYYNDCWVTVTAGTGSGQVRQISDFVGSTLVATVSTNWTTPPDATSVLRVESGNPTYSQSGAIYLDDSRCVNNNIADNNLGGLSITDSGTSTKGVMTASTIAYAIDSQSFGSSAIVRESDAYTTEFRNVSTGVGQTRVYGYRTSSANYERLVQTVTAGVAGFVAMETAGTGADNLKLVLSGSGTESVYATYSGASEVVSRWSGALATAPATPQIGDAFYDTALSALAFWNGTSWIYPQNRTNHFGTQSYTTITGLGTLATVNDAPADNTLYGRSNNVWAAVSLASPLTVGLYGGASWPNINEITFRDTADLIWGLDELSPEVFPFAYTKNPIFFNNNGISSYAGGEKWNIQDSSKIAWTAAARTNMSASIVANSLTTNDISSAFYAFITNQSTGGGGTTTYTTNYLTKALMQNAAVLTVDSGTLTETNMITVQPSWGVTNFAAGYWTTNNALHVEASGTFSAAGDWSGNVFRVKLGAYILTYTFDEPDSTTPTDAAWRLVADIKVQTPGASATTMGVGSLTYYQGTPATLLQSGFIAAVPSGTLDTTVQNTLSVTYDNDATQPLTLKMASLFANEIGAEIVTASGGGSGGSGTLLLVNGATNTTWNLSSNTPAITEYGFTNAAPYASGTNVAFRIPQRVSMIVTNPSSGTFTNPQWGRTIKGFLWGPGGGGGSGRRGLTNTIRSGGGGGGAGGYTEFIIPNLVGGETYTWTNGTGATGGASQTTNSSNGLSGTGGSHTQFGSFVAYIGSSGSGGTASGGNAGGGGTGSYIGLSGGAASSTGANGAAGSSTSTTGGAVARSAGGGGSGGGLNVADLNGSGGSGGTGDRSTALTGAGSGGGGATDGSSGGSSYGSGIITSGGGGGGGGARITSSAGTGGTGGKGGFPGGGGGGGAAGTDPTGVVGNNSGAGGNGGDGAIIIIVE